MITYDDFIGFTFNGRHSSEFGLVRTSDSNRYSDSWIPDLSDTSEEIPSGTGKYYAGETIKERSFTLKCAYDHITENMKHEIKLWLHPDDQMHELIFDEKPYIKYYVKASKGITAKELCFMEENNTRIYKGEVELGFTAYYPFGVCRDKDLSHYTTDGAGDTIKAPTKAEWAAASGLTISPQNTFSRSNNVYSLNLKNPGDQPYNYTINFKKKVNMITGSNPQQVGHPVNVYLFTSTVETGATYAIQYKNNAGILSFYNINTTDPSNMYITVDGNNLYGDFIIGNSKTIFTLRETGGAYDLYHLTALNFGYTYTYTGGTPQLTEGSIVMVNTNNSTNEMRQMYVEGTYVYFLTNPTNPPTTIYLPKNSSPSITFTDTQNSTSKSFTISFPAYLYNEEKYWTYDQIANARQCYIKIDTQKQLIMYKLEGDNQPWIACADLLTNGSLFKIPLGDSTFTITDTNEIIDTSVSVTMDYNYLYI